MNSLIASGSTFEITKACYKGDLKDCNQCSEDNLKHLLKPEDRNLLSLDVSKSSDVEQLWDHCDVPIGKGMKITEQFYEHYSNERNKRDRLKDQVNIHNRRIGKEAVERVMEKKCKCMGLSGSCTLQE